MEYLTLVCVVLWEMSTYDPVQTATIYEEPFPSGEDSDPLWKYYTFQAAKTVLITGGVAAFASAPTPQDIAAADDGSGEGGKAFFRGGTKAVTVTAAEKTALEALGLTVT